MPSATAEAQALRKAFPAQLGTVSLAEDVEGDELVWWSVSSGSGSHCPTYDSRRAWADWRAFRHSRVTVVA